MLFGVIFPKKYAQVNSIGCRSSMGLQKGFLGKSVLAFAILLSLIRRWRPVAFLHECTQLFKWKVFETLLEEFIAHSTITTPTQYGFPINRNRAYSAIIRNDWCLDRGLDHLFRLHINTVLDAGVFFAALPEEAGWAGWGGSMHEYLPFLVVSPMTHQFFLPHRWKHCDRTWL